MTQVDYTTIQIEKRKKAVDVLEELLPKFYEAVKVGFNEYYRVNEGDTQKHRPTTRANIIYDQSVSFIKKNGLILLKVCDKYLIKFKKLDENHKSSNVATKQNSLFLNQEILFDLGESLENLEIGYVFNKAESDMTGIFIVSPKDDKENEWELDLDEYLLNSSSATLFSPSDKSEDTKKRFTVKENKKKENTNGTIQKEKRG